MTRNGDQMLIERTSARTHDLFPIDMAVADYDRTRPLLDGSVKPKGIKLNVDARYVGDFCVEPVYEEYDVAEMSFSWYVTARSRGEPVVALPIFPLRMPVLGYVFVQRDSPFKLPKDLIGRRIGVPSYRFTVNLWLRGIFAEHYGLTPEQVTWVSCQKEEGAGYTVPHGIDLVVTEGNVEQLLDRGEVDAIFVPRLPESYAQGTANFRRLFTDAQAETQAYSRRTGIVPITHTVVMKQSLSEDEPWICESLVRAFMESQLQCDIAVLDPKRSSMADALFFIEQHRAVYGTKSWEHGVSPNRQAIETFLRYAHLQGYTARRLSVEELFPANTLAL